jgi:DNA-binding winged helix-turn-helix (wHTH) protein
MAARELRKHGVQIRLPGQPFCILSLLIERHGEIGSREEMRTKLWASDTFVDFEHSMNSAVKKLRAALGDSPEKPRYIETLPRLGYRFIAPVEEVFSTAGTSAPDTLPGPEVQAKVALANVPHFGRPFLLAISALLVTASIGYFVWFRERPRPLPPNGRLISSRFFRSRISRATAQNYFSEGRLRK